METEFEAKFYPVNKEEYRQKLREIGAKLIVPERKMKRALIDKRHFPQLLCGLIRVRDEGEGVVRLSAKILAEEGGKIGDQKEIDLTVSDFDRMLEILKLMNFVPNGYVENLRETWEYDGAEIVIDTWPGLEPYTEIEAKLENDVKTMSEKLGFAWEDKIITSAVEIYAKVYNLSIDQVLKNYEKLTFENNPFAGLTRRAWKDII
ncbi:MAG: CYTH domain-containing protein [Patescibacteria group bacterium]|jgi:predicted adenylyl cyclase CyaB